MLLCWKFSSPPRHSLSIKTLPLQSQTLLWICEKSVNASTPAELAKTLLGTVLWGEVCSPVIHWALHRCLKTSSSDRPQCSSQTTLRVQWLDACYRVCGWDLQIVSSCGGGGRRRGNHGNQEDVHLGYLTLNIGDIGCVCVCVCKDHLFEGQSDRNRGRESIDLLPNGLRSRAISL